MTASHRAKLLPSPWVVKHAEMISAPGPVLDLACGGGRHTRLLHQLGYRVVAADIDLSGVADMRAKPGVQLVDADLENSDWPFAANAFAGIVVTNYLHRPLFPKLIDSLCIDGVLIYETFAIGNEQYGRPRNPTYLLAQNELRIAFGALLQTIACEQVIETGTTPAVRQRICARKSRSA